jgi:chromosome segregation ATPase
MRNDESLEQLQSLLETAYNQRGLARNDVEQAQQAIRPLMDNLHRLDARIQNLQCRLRIAQDREDNQPRV